MSGRYTHSPLYDLAAAINVLPSIITSRREAQALAFQPLDGGEFKIGFGATVGLEAGSGKGIHDGHAVVAHAGCHVFGVEHGYAGFFAGCQ